MEASAGRGGHGLIRLVQPQITACDAQYLKRRIDEGLLESDCEVARFEQAFAGYVGVRWGVAVNSGTSALHVALCALGVGPGDEVILPSYTCVALLHAVRFCGATPVLVDNVCAVESARFHLCPDAVRRRITRRTRAVLVTQMFGTVLPVTEADFGVPVIEDFTLSLGAAVNGRRAGSFGTIGVCSLHASKMISCDQGGMIVSSDAGCVDRARRFASYGAPMEAWRTAPPESLRGRYELAGSYRMSALQAALGMSQLGQLESFIARRRQLARRYTVTFREAGIICPNVPDDDSNVFFRYLIRVQRPVVPVIERLRTLQIQAGRGVYPPLHGLLDLPDADFPGAMDCVRSLLSVPLHPGLTDADVERLLPAVVTAVTQEGP